jgi:hypothetical protein
MIYLASEQMIYEPITARLSPGAGPGDERIRLTVGSTVIRLDVAAVDELVDSLVACLAQLDGREAG